MNKILYLFGFISFALSSCSNDSDSNTVPIGHSYISMKVDGKTYEYTKIQVIEEMIGYDLTLYIRAEKDGNTSNNYETFVIRPVRGGVNHNTIFTSALAIFQGYNNDNIYYPPYDQPMTANFLVNSKSKIEGSFEGFLRDGDNKKKVTDGYINIEYGTSNFADYIPN